MAMKIVHFDQAQETVGSSHRGGQSTYFRMFDGEEGSPGNFSLIVATSPGRFSPRHRHNFEQFRYQLKGIADYGRTGKLKPGMLGYFPEAVHYGPQTQEEGETLSVLVLQFGGPSGSGYLGRAGQLSATEELRKFGEFRDGVFRRREDVEGKRNKDAFEAIWEHVNQRPLVYPSPRYEAPILMDPESFGWISQAGSSGLARKNLGIFSEAECGIAMVKIDPGAHFVANGRREIFVVLKGTGLIESEPYRRLSAVQLDGDAVTITAEESTELLHFRLPDLAYLERAAAEHRAHDMVAAE
jgi:mannose-6-phosphate isomerase-like protein (cupin superfamily)